MFDWTQVEGYREDMTAEEKLALLENFNMPDTKAGFVPKAQFDKTASDLAATKKQLRDYMTDEQKKEADRLAEHEALKTEVESLRRDKVLSEHKASFLALGYDDKAAAEAAAAMVDGKMDVVFAAMKQHGVEAEKNLRAEILKSTPTPPAGGNDGGKDKSEGVKLAERVAKEHADSNKTASDILSKYM